MTPSHLNLAALGLAGLCFFATDAHAQTPTVTVQVDPLTTALGFVHVQVEARLNDQFSVYVGPSLRLFNGLLDLDNDRTYKGYGAEAGLRWFPKGGAPLGWWAQVRGVGAYLVADTDITDVGGYVSALGGYTACFDDWFILAGGLGVQYLHYTVDGLGTKGIAPAAHTTIGVAF